MTIFIPLLAIIAAITATFWYGLRNPPVVNCFLVGLGLGIILIISIGLGFYSTRSSDAAILAFVYGILLSGVAFNAGSLLLIILKGRRKLFGAILAFLFPIMLFIAITTGSRFTPTSLSIDHGEQIAQSLHQYRADHGTFPSSLDQLVPTYLDEIRQPPTMWGWLYESTADEFTFGYVSYIDRMGYFYSVLTHDNAEWDLRIHSEVPFDLPPTPSSFPP